MLDKKELQGFDISEKTAAVIGCGGLGCHISMHLACSGIGRLFLCDYDTVSESNLNRQFLYSYEDIGKRKAALAKKKLRAISPETEIISIERKLISENDLTFAAEADILFLAVDNNNARKAVQAFCRNFHIPLVNGGVSSFYGTAYLYVPGLSPDLEAAGLLKTENSKPIPVSPVVGVIGALEAQLGIRYLLGNTEQAGKLFVYDNESIDCLTIINIK